MSPLSNFIKLALTYVISIISSVIILSSGFVQNEYNFSLPGGYHNMEALGTGGIISDSDLVKYALDKINEDRAKYNLFPVNLSKNQAAQSHAQSLFENKDLHPSHLTTDGMKPYMKYSKYNGTGYVEQNVAVGGYERGVIQKCKDEAITCKKIDPHRQIDNFEWTMINNDTLCCENKHKINILNRHHTDVSIGIAYDDYYFALVQNFENNYIKYDKPLTHSDRQINLSGKILRDNFDVDTIGIYYDKTPSKLFYEQKKDEGRYNLGKLIAQVAKPPPVFLQYEPPGNHTLIVAKNWRQDGNYLDIMFDLSPVAKMDGVYTIVVYLKDNKGVKFPVTSYSLFI